MAPADLPPEAAECVRQGLAASQANDTTAALDLFARAAQVAPDSGIPWFLAGSEHAAAGQVEQAEAAFANAVLLAPEMPLARYQLGLLQFSTGRAATAALTWQALLNLPDTHALGHYVRGFMALAADDLAAARQHCEAGLACLVPDNPALAGDIRKLLARLPEQTDALQADAHPASGEPAPDHVLLSNYRKRSD